MKKLFKIGLVGLMVGGILSACGTGTKGYELVQNNEIQSQSVSAEEEEIEGPDFSSYQVEATEYTDLKVYIEELKNYWQDGSEYKTQYGEMAEWTLANGAVHYINYFEDDIEKMGLTNDFKELQIVAYELKSLDDDGKEGSDSYKELNVKFTTKLNEIYTKMLEDKIPQ
jgi:hypothetical protein